jgi:hypothetical protein
MRAFLRRDSTFTSGLGSRYGYAIGGGKFEPAATQAQALGVPVRADLKDTLAFGN